MASRTQIRLQQLTGSAVDIKTSASTSTAVQAASVNENDLEGLLGEFAGALHRIHGAAGNEFLNNTVSELRDANSSSLSTLLSS